MAQVTAGGMEMKSDSLTADQLEDLNRRLQESLRAQVRRFATLLYYRLPRMFLGKELNKM